METVFYILLAVFGVYSVMHLVFCFLEKEKLRKWTKPFCLVILGIAAIFGAPSYPLIYIGAFLGAIGDVFLIRKNDLRFFLIGTGLFIIGHGCYFTQAFIIMKDICFVTTPWWVFLIIFGTLLVLTFVLYPVTKGLAGKATLAGNFYMPFLVVQIAVGFVLAHFLKNGGLVAPAGGFLYAIGYIFFLASDAILIFSTFVKDFPRRDFPIMLFYLLGEFFIVLGLVSIVI